MDNTFKAIVAKRDFLVNTPQEKRNLKEAGISWYPKMDTFCAEKKAKLLKMLEKRGYKYYPAIEALILNSVLPYDSIMAVQMLVGTKTADGLTCVAMMENKHNKQQILMKGVAVAEHKENPTHQLIVLVHEIVHALTVYKDGEVVGAQSDVDRNMSEGVAYAAQAIVAEKWGIDSSMMSGWGLAQYGIGDFSLKALWPMAQEAANIILEETE